MTQAKKRAPISPKTPPPRPGDCAATTSRVTGVLARAGPPGQATDTQPKVPQQWRTGSIAKTATARSSSPPRAARATAAAVPATRNHAGAHRGNRPTIHALLPSSGVATREPPLWLVATSAPPVGPSDVTGSSRGNPLIHSDDCGQMGNHADRQKHQPAAEANGSQLPGRDSKPNSPSRSRSAACHTGTRLNM